MRTYTKLGIREIRKILKGWDEILYRPFDHMIQFRNDLNEFLFVIEREKKRKFSKRELPRIVKTYAYGWDDGGRYSWL